MIQMIFNKYNVKRAFVFGSVCTDRFSENSDIDFLIEFEDFLDPLVKGENYLCLIEELQILLNRPIDILTQNSLRNPYLIESINASRELIYGKAA